MMPKTPPPVAVLPPLKARVYQGFLSFFWFVLWPAYSVFFFFLLVGSFLFGLLGPFCSLALIPLITCFAWCLTFWKLCRRFPSMYPFQFLTKGFTSRWLWRRPPLCFYTEAFQKEFQEKWVPYFKTFQQVSSSYDTSSSMASKFDVSSRPTFMVNPGSATNMAMNNISQINGTNTQHCFGEYR